MEAAVNERALAWDGYDAYLFDIDGTLINCTDAVHYFAFCNALTAVAGRPMNLDGVVAHGNTDVGILRDALQRAGVEERAWRARIPEMRDAMCREVERNRNDLRAAALPGVADALQHLRSKGAALGVATGNLQAIGQVKLAHCGLLGYFDFAGYSDCFEYRKDVFAFALQGARSLKGSSARVCAVGDTPADVQAAQANGIDVIAVATGVYSRDALMACRPTLCVGTLAELSSLGV